jgi:hypothetical protein
VLVSGAAVYEDWPGARDARRNGEPMMRIIPRFALNFPIGFAVAISLALGSLVIDGAVAADDKTVAARTAALQWLAELDRGAYAETWELAAPLFQAHVTKDQWIRSASAVRTPLGALQRRELASAEYTTTLPGAPDGEYVVLKFTSSFANKHSAQETVTPMLAEGDWRVSGYFVR